MTKLLLITNNPVFAREVQVPYGAELRWIDGEVDAVFQACLKLLDEGWYLAVDPIAGYRVRPCPVHTILMTLDKRFAYDTTEKGYLWGIHALSQLMEKFIHEREDFRAHARDEKKLGGHSAVDCSIACRSLESISLRLNLD